MDTNKENELLQNLDRQTPPATGAAASHLADGRPSKAGAKWAAVNPPRAGKTGQQQGSSQASQPSADGLAESMFAPTAVEQVTPEMVNRMEAYGTEAVYNAGAEDLNN